MELQMDIHIYIENLIVNFPVATVSSAAVVVAGGVRLYQWRKKRQEEQAQAIVLDHFRKGQAAMIGTFVHTPPSGHLVQTICESLVAKGQLERAMLPGGYCLPGRIG
jgi:hypothetical protein